MADGIKDIFTWKDADGNTHVIPIDLVVNHSDDRSAEVTSHPVEKGANINDHVIQQADTLSLELAQTQTPFITPAAPGIAFTAPKGFSIKNVKLDVQPNAFSPGGLLFLSRAVGGALSSLGNALGITHADTPPNVNVIVADGPIDRIGDLHDALIAVKQNAYFCTVTFRGRIYPDYIVTKVGWKSVKGEVGLGRFTVELQSIHIVSTETADLPNPASLRLKPIVSSAKPPKPGGNPEDLFGKNLESLPSQLFGGGASSS
jgi:hypothetical protein